MGAVALGAVVWLLFKKLKVKWKQTILVEEEAEVSQDTIEKGEVEMEEEEEEREDDDPSNKLRVNRSLDMRDTYKKH